jgi:hypothetical protein
MKNVAVLSLCVFLLLACADRRPEIERAMKRYDRFILQVDADSIASCFAPDGRLGKLGGRDSIRAFLKTFNEVKVLEQASTSETVVIDGDAARQEGHYRQKVILEGDTIIGTGKYSATWVWDGQAGWLLKKMETFPDKE